MPRLPHLFKSVVRPTVALLTLSFIACEDTATLPVPTDSVSRDAGKGAKDAGRRRDAGSSVGEKDPSDEADEDDGDDGEASEDEAPEDEASDDDDTGASAAPSKKPDASAATDAGVRTDAAAPAAGAADCDALTYESFGKKFVATYCTECHSGSSSSSALGGVSLDSLANIQKNKAYLKKVTAPRPNGIEPRMPKGGNDALTDEERLKFGAWVDCGPK